MPFYRSIRLNYCSLVVESQPGHKEYGYFASTEDTFKGYNE